MSRYQYVGPGPHEDAVIGLVRPGDVREFDEEPAWGPWEPLDEPETTSRPTDVEAGLITAEQKALSADQGLTAPSLTVPPAKEF